MTTDTNNDFERKIKSSLEGFEAPYATGDWEDMDSRLNTLPKQNNTFNLENLKSLKFKWNFSMNIYIALIACAGFFLLMYKLGGVSGTSSVVAPPTPMNTIPVTNTTDIRTPSNGVAPQSDRNSDSPEANSGLSSRTTPIDSIPNRVYAPVEVPHQTVPVEASKDKSIAPADPIAGPPVTTEKLKGVVFGDMIDPKRGPVYNTSEKVMPPSQTKVNVGWNDYVIYDPASTKTTDSTKSAQGSEAGVKTATDNQSASEKRKASRKQKNLDKAQKSSVSDSSDRDPAKAAEVKAAPVNSPIPREGGDTVKRIKLKNPKYKSDHSILDPY